MESSSAAASAPAPGPTADSGGDKEQHEEGLPEVINIVETGDLILDATFENSKTTLRSARRSLPRMPASSSSSSPLPPATADPPLRARVRLGFRVSLAVLRRQSAYFDRLLGDARFREGRAVDAALSALAARGVAPGAADPADLPWVAVHDDDEATLYARREVVFADLLRVLHGREASGARGTTPAAAAAAAVTMQYVTTLAVLADRFDCTAAVGRYVGGAGLKFKWPVTSKRPLGSSGTKDEALLGPVMSKTMENILRQKILVSWLLNQPGKFQEATKELIMNGSCRWSSFGEEEGGDTGADAATWWYLQDGLEEELQYRRHCILNTIASVQQHFLALYASRGPGAQRQCKLGYDSSAACDSYQLGEMVKFLVHKRLLFLADYSPASLDALPDAALLPVDALLAALRQCPAYQVDKNHANCGLRTRLLPILDFIQALLSANSVPLARAAWKANRQAAAWMPPAPGQGADRNRRAGVRGGGHDDGGDDSRPFRFTRSMAGDQRLRFENAMGADKFAREVFTATSWDWTAEDQGPEHVSTTPKFTWR
ncbi:hypothetical protein F5X96DRAFT_11329 [Biscogniauxia mediterranea]|nr:hypothetical protein F5X96DRAFT_11329 [Biscogniauxia mediterranea]